MTSARKGNKLRILKIKARALGRRPRVSHEPWAGFTPNEAPRETPLDGCPSPRCRRAQACLAAHFNLYCRRTHFSPAEKEKRERRHPLKLALELVMPVIDPHDLDEQVERIAELARVRREHTADMTARWKAGELDKLYGKYTPKGVIKKPPPKIYVGEPRKRSWTTGDGRRIDPGVGPA